ncbi:hypothetical protein ACFO25_17745 [Paenactinomyces guangxiensis]|uniref:Uncharacterized protein n=1 Tax=Paenactinomyces guangxiensis TaxID=1490290 RepID=A0A7W1WRL3_9BACL|nr:hypothetical protein [Paenactinomyces guangxiensis]MBA4494692.1 hypothetical protein [Paenactinomyces guangxiensis]MBH8591776.1 hypothetical protein [Paenactinomyces guangxiensis]
MRKLMIYCCISALVSGIFTGLSFNRASASEQKLLNDILADYAGLIREKTPRADGIHHVDTPASIQRLKELHINTYYYLIWHEPTDWDDLRSEFVPAAEKAGINVVVYLVPPSESTGPRKSYPYLTDYLAWAKAIAELSLEHPNVIGWAIDDFNHNLDFYTPEYMSQMKSTAKSINPKLTFTPVMYATSLTEDFLDTRGIYIDGIILAYRDDPYRNTQVWSTEQEQIDRASRLVKAHNLSLIWMLYASQLSNTPANPSREYVRETVQIALDNMRRGKLDGVVTYVLHKEFVPEPTDDKAFSGKGYMSFFVPSGVATNPGDAVSVTQLIRPKRTSGKYSITFRTMDEGPNAPGYHFKQVLIDDAVVWEQDVAQNTTNRQWEHVALDLTPYLTGKTKAKLTFRLYEKNGVRNYFNNVGFDRIEANGFSIENGNFEDKSSWEPSKTFPGMIGETLKYDPERRVKVFRDVKASYLTYDLYDEIISVNIDIEIKNSLIVKIGHALDDYFAEENEKAMHNLNALSNEIYAQTGKSIPGETGNFWISTIQQLKDLY